MAIRKIAIRRRLLPKMRPYPVHLQSAIHNLDSTIHRGGIAQLVERQLCKLEVRGSNPLASKAESVEANIHNPGTFSDALAGA